ncbi:MAG: cytochrome C [Gammaproteobacteria bacterium]|nr:cytochrome C [Gammaproteobacteria bacterium]
MSRAYFALRWVGVVLAGWLALGAGPATAARSLEQVLMPGDVSAAHAETEHDCRACHKLMEKNAQSGLCLDCHDDVAGDIAAHAGFHGRVERTECVACHSEHLGRDADIAAFDHAAFDHAQTDFALDGAHGDLACRRCHVDGKRWREAPQACVACHRDDNVHKPTLGDDCASCHQPERWQGAKFDHLAETHFALEHSHAEARCNACHVRHDYRDTPTQCVGCHRADDEHHGRFGDGCQDCHRETRWDEVVFDHDRDTDFDLHGKHAPLECKACHAEPLAVELSTDCASCHRDDDAHRGHLGTRCGDCHVDTGWRERRFDHARHTRFALQGAHREPECADCHADMKFRQKTPSTCNGCHRDDDQARGHQGRFGTRCESCHVAVTWKKLVFEHDRDTEFALTGAHREAPCTACHRDGVYEQKLERACIACHRGDDEHRGNLGEDCVACHGTAKWAETNFDHAKTRFALTGGHREVECRECHASDRFWETGLECVACHAADDPHAERLGPRCDQCHDPSDWKDVHFEHDRDTGFALAGAHRDVACLACHRSPVQGRIMLADDCYSCHKGDDVHFGTYGQACGRCHASTRWREVDEQGRAWARQGGPPDDARP